LPDRLIRGQTLRRARPACAVACALIAATAVPASRAAAHQQETPRLQVDEFVPAFAISAQNRVVYAVRRVVHTKHYEMERDDIWLATLGGKKTRIVKGEKLVKSAAPFSYRIESLRWRPDGQGFIAQMATSQMADERGAVQQGEMSDLFSDSGKEMEIAGTHDSIIPNGYQAAWLGDNTTVAYLAEAVKPHLLFHILTVRPASGREEDPFPKRTFTAVAWDVPHSAAVAVERDAGLHGPFRLVWLDLLRKERRELAKLDAYAGQLTISHSGGSVAYFRDGENLEIRDVDHPDRAKDIHVLYGKYQWSADDSHILLQRGAQKDSGDFVWIDAATGKYSSVLHGLPYGAFQISPDGMWLGLLDPGGYRLRIIPLPSGNG
jgi:hypothetical protein